MYHWFFTHCVATAKSVTCPTNCAKKFLIKTQRIRIDNWETGTAAHSYCSRPIIGGAGALRSTTIRTIKATKKQYNYTPNTSNHNSPVAKNNCRSFRLQNITKQLGVWARSNWAEQRGQKSDWLFKLQPWNSSHFDAMTTRKKAWVVHKGGIREAHFYPHPRTRSSRFS